MVTKQYFLMMIKDCGVVMSVGMLFLKEWLSGDHEMIEDILKFKKKEAQ